MNSLHQAFLINRISCTRGCEMKKVFFSYTMIYFRENQTIRK